MRLTRRRICASATALAASVVRPRLPRADEVLYFGVPPWQRGQDFDDITRLYRPMLDYLEQRTGARIKLISARNYEDMIDQFATGQVHFGTISPIPYIRAQQKTPGVRMLLTELTWNADHTAKLDSYLSEIVALKSRTDLRTLEDLRGKRFGFVSEDSTSGFVFPAAYLRRHGLDWRTFFGSVQFLGSHPKVTDAIVEGQIDAGATWSYNMAQAMVKHGDVFNVLQQMTVPNLGIATHPSMPDSVRRAIKDALLRIDPALLDGLPTAGYVERPDTFYDVAREALAVEEAE